MKTLNLFTLYRRKSKVNKKPIYYTGKNENFLRFCLTFHEYIVCLSMRTLIMEKVENIAKYILFLDTNRDIFVNNLVNLNGRNSYEGNIRLNKYLHIMQMVYFAINDQKLFPEDMYAFDNGVVVDYVMSNYRYLSSNRDNYSFSDNQIKAFVEKISNILKYAPLDELINISHQDEEWKKKHNHFNKSDQLIDIVSQKDNYKKMCSDFIELLD